ncbi:unnamed protein product [Prorocentrum cordatum]|uniref:Calpain catalytic domain-containing protein n=1 Tax=Prorocentrum cordatum TaxID=2364126 RepID=A0ABN9WN88_9DINO|nr:unnamed protein product [Polarella glacialis]
MGVLTGYMCDIVQISDMPEDAAWEYVRAMLGEGFLLCSGTKNGADAPEAKALGLTVGHAYSLLTAHESPLPGGASLRLLELRNPHGRGVWKGAWSDLSPEWQLPHAPALRHDGVRQKPPTARFWMSFGDFLKWFGSVQYCKVREDAAWGDERLPVPLAPPGVLGDRARAMRFRARERTTVELAMLQAGGRGRPPWAWWTLASYS